MEIKIKKSSSWCSLSPPFFKKKESFWIELSRKAHLSESQQFSLGWWESWWWQREGGGVGWREEGCGRYRVRCTVNKVCWERFYIKNNKHCCRFISVFLYLHHNVETIALNVVASHVVRKCFVMNDSRLTRSIRLALLPSLLLVW